MDDKLSAPLAIQRRARHNLEVILVKLLKPEVDVTHFTPELAIAVGIRIRNADVRHEISDVTVLLDTHSVVVSWRIEFDDWCIVVDVTNVNSDTCSCGER